MLSRSLTVLPLTRKVLFQNAPVATTLVQRLAHDTKLPENFRHPTMDDMLVPCGSWQENYDNKQRKYNVHLLFGTGFFIVTLVVGYYSGHFDLYLAYPKRPAPRE